MVVKANDKRTPPIMTTGIYTCRSPFDKLISIDTVYTTEAIRTFPELERQNINVLKDIYLANGLTEEHYLVDKGVSASVIVLTAQGEKPVRVPNTYIESYPSMSGIPYNRNVLIVDCGIVPSGVDLNTIIADINSVVVKHIGVDNKTYVDSMEYEGNVTYDEHIALERARKQAIREHVPLEAQLADALKSITKLKKDNDDFVELIAELQGFNGN